MRLVRTLVLGVGLCAAAPLTLTSTALADSPHPWSDTAASSYTLPAGTRCPFTLSGTVVQDKERIRTVETYADGSPRTMEVVGQLVLRYANEDTGASVERNLTGNGIYTLRPDGSPERLTLQAGHMAVGLRPTDPDGPGVLVLTGAGHSVAFGEDGTRTVTYGNGPVEDICETLAR